MRRWITGLACLLAFATTAHAQVQTGQIFGKVTDSSGAVLPGVTITASSPVLLQPLTAVSSETGSYQFPNIPIGTYSVKFELAGFKTVARENIRIEIGFNAQVNTQLEVGAIAETVEVSGAAPVVDLRDTTKGARFNAEALQSIPSARDPWVMIEQAPGVAMDRQNVGGSASGQQSNFVARGAAMSQQKWNVDGVDVTDMSATGGSPYYFDFDSFEEMQITTGGSDASMQTAGVGVNIVTKTGTDHFKGSGRTYVTDDKFEANNVTDDIRKLGASSGGPIQNIKDYGFELGGPIAKGRAWFWGSYGKQNINVGVNNFYLKTPTCAPIAANPLSYSIEDVRGCLNTDLTTLNNYNWKIAAQVAKDNKLSVFNSYNEKIRNARGADDLHPIESTNRQMSVQDTSLGPKFWDTGTPATWKFTDQHIFSDRWMLEGSFSHVGNNFVMALHDDSLASVQPLYDVNTGNWARSLNSNTYVRPTNSVDLTSNYFMPGVFGADHSFKIGYKYRRDEAYSASHYGGNVVARYNSPTTPFTVPYSGRFYRNSVTDYFLYQQAAYVQDTVTHGRLTMNLGIRWDRQLDNAAAASVPGSPFMNELDMNGRPFTFLPAINFPGVQGGVIWNNFAPRLGFTYDVQGNGRTVVKGSFGQYYGQRGTNDMSSTLNTIGSTYVEFPWNDANKDGFVQMNEIDTSRLLASGGNYNAANPAATTSSNRNDPNMKNDRTDEVLVGFDKEIGPEFAVSASYIYRKYSNIRTSYYYNAATGQIMPYNDWTAYTYTPSCTVAGARCGSVTVFGPNYQVPTTYIYMNEPGYSRSYNGIELSARKRMTGRWSMNGSLAFNNSARHYDGLGAYNNPNNSYTDPTNFSAYNNAQYAPESTSSGLDNVFVNAKWIGRLTGSYRLPLWDIGLAGFYNARQGYPFLPSINVATNAKDASGKTIRSGGSGSIQVILDPLGSVRLPTFQTVDFRVDKTFTLGHLRVYPAMDIFNLFNSNTILSERRNQNASNGNQISSILAPRVIRFGFRVTF